MTTLPSAAVIPQRLMIAAALHLLFGVVAWLLASKAWPDLMGYYFAHLGPAYLLSFSFLEWAFALRVRRAFQPREEMYRAWTLIMACAALRFAGVLLAHVLNARSEIRTFGMVMSGPLQLCLLAAGLGIVLRLYGSLGYSFRLKRIDWFLIAVCAGVALSGIYENIVRPSVGMFTDPLLCALLVQAIVLRRSVSQMGGGLVAACWTSYVLALFLTALGDAGLVLMAYNLIPADWMPITGFIWYPAAAAYAVGPAFLSEAVSLATRGQSQRYPAACSSNSSA